MEIVTQIKLNKEDIIEMIKEKFQVEGQIEFIFVDETYKCGMTDGVQHYGTRTIFNGVIITNSKQK